MENQEITRVVVFGDNSLMHNVLTARLDECKQVVVKAKIDRTAALWDSLATGNQADAVVLATTDESLRRVVRMLRTSYSDLKVIVVGDFHRTHETLTWLEAGAHHVTMVRDSFASLLRVLQGQRDGECTSEFIREIAGRVQNLRMRESIRLEQKQDNEPILEPLTDSEERVARLVARGMLNKQIARELRLGMTTVKSHVTRVLKKLKVCHRREIVERLSPAWN